MASTRRSLALAVGSAFRADPWRSAGVVVLSTFASLSGVLGAYWLKRIVDAAAAGDEKRVLEGAVGMGLTIGAGILANAVVTVIQFPLKERTGLYLDRRIVTLVSAIPTIEHHERPDYLDRLDVLRREMPVLGFAGFYTAEALALVVQVVATSLLLASVNPLLLAVPLFALPSLWTATRAERCRQAALEVTAELTRRARELFELSTSPSAGKELRVFGLGGELLARHRRDARRADVALDAAAVRGLAWTAAGWLIFAAGYACAIALVVNQAVTGRATLGDVVLALALVAQVNEQVGGGVATVAEVVRIAKAAERYLWLSDYGAERQVAAGDQAPAPDRMEKGIELRGVAFRYPGTETDVVAGFDLFLPAGAIVAVVGDNGAGKSTLVKLLCRFYEPSEGTISVDGTDLRRIDVGEWRERMSAGFQDFAHFELLASQTVGVGDIGHIDDEAAVAAALERAASADVVSSLPQGLQTQLGATFDQGVELSGGQWQKLAMARAMMRPAPILLVLDEPTAALDAETEHNLFSHYASVASKLARGNGAITLVVSHRFSTVRMADLIVVVDGGRIVGAGSHDQLMAAGGLYAELYELQARAYR